MWDKVTTQLNTTAFKFTCTSCRWSLRNQAQWSHAAPFGMCTNRTLSALCRALNDWITSKHVHCKCLCLEGLSYRLLSPKLTSELMHCCLWLFYFQFSHSLDVCKNLQMGCTHNYWKVTIAVFQRSAFNCIKYVSRDTFSWGDPKHQH